MVWKSRIVGNDQIEFDDVTHWENWLASSCCRNPLTLSLFL
jgi:hypothetical protein